MAVTDRDDVGLAGKPAGRPRTTLRLLTRPATNKRSRRALLSLGVGFGLWELSVLVFDVSPLIVAPPSVLAQRFAELIGNGTLIRHTRISMVQFSIGYFGCALFAIPLGLAMGRFERLRDMLDPWISALYATPSISLAPLFIIWLGFGTTAKAFIVALLAFFPIVINTTAGVDSVSQRFEEVASAFRADRFEHFAKVMFPGALPYIFAGLRLAIGRGLVGLVVADLFGSTAGLGHMILRAAQLFNTADVFVATIVLAMIGVTLTSILKALQNTICSWQSVGS